MNGKACLAAAWVTLFLVGGARGQFTPGHVFVTDPEYYTWDRIWEIDPKTGGDILFNPTSDSPQDEVLNASSGIDPCAYDGH